MKINRLFFEFSNEGRFEVFKNLSESKRHSQLEKELNIRGSEISRHLKRLIEEKLVKKTIDNKYVITNIGKIFLQIFDIVEVSLRHENFFNIHDISFIPLYLILQLGSLKFIKINKITMQNIELWSKYIKESQKFILAISDQFQGSILPVVEKKINNTSIKIRALISKEMLKSTEYEKLEDRHAFYKKLNIEENLRILKQVCLSLLVTDKGAIIFLGKEGKIDYSECLYDNSEKFINWSTELFEWYWNEGDPLGQLQKRKIE